jgi:hypothetical protein
MVDTNQLCERLSTIQCAGEEHRCANPGRTRAQCEDAMKTGCLSQLHLDEIAAKPNTGFDKARAETAFTAFEHMASLCDPSIAKWGITVDGLRGILQGTLDATESCMPSVTNLMNPVIVGAALASCKNLETTACLPTMFSWTCAPVHGEGGACFTDANCSTGLYCDNPNSNQFNSPCRARKADGAACVNANECDSLRCKNKVCATAGVDAAYCLQ